jgi:predicted TIM-barrel fold metal-dependent hydrolase
MDVVGVNAVVVDEFWGFDDARHPVPGYTLPGGSYRPISPTAELAVALHPERFAYVVRYEPDDPDLGSLIAELRSHPGRLALRIIPFQLHPGSGRFRDNWEVARQDFEAIEHGVYDRYLSLAQEHEVPVFIQIAGVELPPQTELLAGLLRTYPDLQFVVDHCGVTLPADPPASRSELADQFAAVGALARYPNLALKWSHAPDLSADEYPYADLMPVLHGLLEAFGPERIMWAGDWMPGITRHAWAESLYYLRSSDQLSPSEKAAILGGTVRTILRWPLTETPAEA